MKSPSAVSSVFKSAKPQPEPAIKSITARRPQGRLFYFAGSSEALFQQSDRPACISSQRLDTNLPWILHAIGDATLTGQIALA
jgi:hypothetical protein